MVRMTSPFDEIPDRGPAPGWMQVTIQAPPEVGNAVLLLLEEDYNFKDVDWCCLGRDEDNARIDYAPSAPLTKKPPD